MPLNKSKSKAAFNSNIKELLNSYKKGGDFAKGKSKAKARQMAIAAAYKIRRGENG
jgi:hypothetical protein